MNENILDLEPKALWRNFRELTLIPRPSNHEEAVLEKSIATRLLSTKPETLSTAKRRRRLR